MQLKFFFLATLFLSFGNPSEKATQYFKDFYKNGKVKAEGWLENGQKIGYWKFYHQNSTVSAQGYYKNGKREKYWYFYSSNKVRSMEGHYEKGKKTKWWLFYDKNGHINHKCQLSGGKKNGYCLQYLNEKLTSAEKYKNGKRIKKWTSYSGFRRENKLSDLR